MEDNNLEFPFDFQLKNRLFLYWEKIFGQNEQ